MRSGQFVRCNARVLQRVPRNFQKQTLLRVHTSRFTRGDSEVRGIETIDAVHEATVSRIHRTRNVRVGVEIGIDIPSVDGHLADRVNTVVEQAGERVRRIGAWESAAQTHDGDRLVAAIFAGIESLLQFQREQRETLRRQRRDLFEEVGHARPFRLAARSRSTSSSDSSDNSLISDTAASGARTTSAVGTAVGVSGNRSVSR